MRAAFLLGAVNPSQWYRMMEPARVFPGAEFVFAGHGFTADVIERAAACDIVQMSYVHRREEVAAMAELKRRGAVIALDYDDAVLRMGLDREVIVEALRLCDVLTLTTRRLVAEFVAAGRPNMAWAIVPNRIDTLAWTPRRPAARGNVTVIAYAGSRAHTADFAMVADDVWQAMRQHPTAVLRVLGCCPLDVPGDLRWRVAERAWVPVARHRQAVELLDADIALAPLRDTPFNRGRSALKWMQFAALGVPMIASDVPAYRDLASVENTAALVRPGASWRAPLAALLSSPALRARMGTEARHAVSAHDLGRDSPTRAAVYEATVSRVKRQGA